MPSFLVISSMGSAFRMGCFCVETRKPCVEISLGLLASGETAACPRGAVDGVEYMLDHVAELELIAIRRYGDRAPRAEKEADRKALPRRRDHRPQTPRSSPSFFGLFELLDNDSAPADHVCMGLNLPFDTVLAYRPSFSSPLSSPLVLSYLI